jgi:1,4-alpha-glucan branching enzyme
MGTVLYKEGVTFRVWAPFASSVFAAGTFNEWSATANPFASEGNGYWSVDVPGAKVGDEYQFVIHNGDQTLWHKNPYASEVVNSSGNAIIHDPDFDWTGDAFTMPPWNELVIYEMHVGSFNDSSDAGPGTFEDIGPKLPYLRDLGINAIEIMPVLEFPMSFSWGYNPCDPFAVESGLQRRNASHGEAAKALSTRFGCVLPGAFVPPYLLASNSSNTL